MRFGGITMIFRLSLISNTQKLRLEYNNQLLSMQILMTTKHLRLGSPILMFLTSIGLPLLCASTCNLLLLVLQALLTFLAWTDLSVGLFAKFKRDLHICSTHFEPRESH